MTNTYKILVVEREKERLLRGLNINSRIILKLMLKRVLEYVLDSRRSRQSPMTDYSEHGNEPI
jgi:hypothetical protein